MRSGLLLVILKGKCHEPGQEMREVLKIPPDTTKALHNTYSHPKPVTLC